jgi:hypothetical protein
MLMGLDVRMPTPSLSPCPLATAIPPTSAPVGDFMPVGDGAYGEPSSNMSSSVARESQLSSSLCTAA